MGRVRTQRPAADGLFEIDDDRVMRLLTARCEACGARVFPVSAACPRCGSASVVPSLAGPGGAVWSHTEVHETFGRGSLPPPYGIALVDLDDGVRARGLIHPDSPPIAIGDRVVTTKVVLETVDDCDLFTFAFTADGAPDA